MSAFNGCKVFTATMVAQRQTLGETVTSWLAQKRQQSGFEVVDILIRQSSDAAFHCVAVVIFFNESTSPRTTARPTTRKMNNS